MTTEQETEVSISDIAASALKRAKNDVQKATDIMQKEVMGHPGMYRALMDPLVRAACYDAIGKCIRADRRQVWTAPNYTASGNGSRVHELSRGNLLMFSLPGGKRLGDANRDEVNAAAQFYNSQAVDMSQKANWLAKIAERVGNKIVSKVFTDEQLRKLQEEVCHG